MSGSCSPAECRAEFIKSLSIYLDGTCTATKSTIDFTHITVVDSFLVWGRVESNLEKDE
jgi:hypothetical protein